MAAVGARACPRATKSAVPALAELMSTMTVAAFEVASAGVILKAMEAVTAAQRPAPALTVAMLMAGVATTTLAEDS